VEYSEAGDSILFGNAQFKAIQELPDDRMTLYKCNCCRKLIVKEVNDFWHDPHTPHWNRIVRNII